MNFKKVQEYIDHMIELGDKENNPIYYVSAKGCINGVIYLCETKGLLTQQEKEYLLLMNHRLTQLLLIYSLKGLTDAT